MNAAAHLSSGPSPAIVTETKLRVTAYDRVASALIALLVVLGLAVLALFTIWMTGRVVFNKPPSKIERFVYGDSSDDKTGFDGEMEEPGADDLEELNQTPIEETLLAITTVVTSQAAAIDAAILDGLSSSGGLPKGDLRRPGNGPTEPPNVIPPWQRWEIQFTTTDIATYAQQLDSFGIELGAIGGGVSVVQYAGNLAQAKPNLRSGDPQDEQRMYMTWREAGGVIARFDRQLLARAGIATDGRIVVQFYPQEVEEQLLRLEATEASGRTPSEYQKTVFGVRPVGGGYEFLVIDQLFRPRTSLH